MNLISNLISNMSTRFMTSLKFSDLVIEYYGLDKELGKGINFIFYVLAVVLIIMGCAVTPLLISLAICYIVNMSYMQVYTVLFLYFIAYMFILPVNGKVQLQTMVLECNEPKFQNFLDMKNIAEKIAEDTGAIDIDIDVGNHGGIFIPARWDEEERGNNKDN